MSIVRRVEDQPVVVTKGAQGGPGEIIARKLACCDEDLWNKGRLLNVITLEPGSGVGYHVHSGDGEVYYMMEGTAEYNDNGTVVTISAGDVTFTKPGEGHSITNVGDSHVKFLAIIMYE